MKLHVEKLLYYSLEVNHDNPYAQNNPPREPERNQQLAIKKNVEIGSCAKIRVLIHMTGKMELSFCKQNKWIVFAFD